MDSKNRLGHIINCLVEYRKLWLLPAIAGLVLSTFYAFFLQGETWTARQSMIIRDDLLGQTFKPGSFISEEAMKSAQETVLATARRPEVIRKTLETLGPANRSFLGFGGGNDGDWPSNQVIEDFRGAVSFENANGGEFGKSEVIVLAAKGSSPQRSVDFLSILMNEVDAKLSEIQGDRFESMEAELRATRDSTMRSREAMEQELMRMESEFEGTDIYLVRSLNERAGGTPSASENKLNEIAAQRRDAIRKLVELRSNRQSLIDASKDPIRELPTSAELLASQPALSEMVTGLTKAKQDLAEASSTFQPAHTKVESGREKVASIQRQIQQSIGTIVRGLDNQIAVHEERVVIYDELLEESTRRLTSVSRKRAPYATLTREVEKLNEDYSEASARLTRMRSRKMASASIKLLTRIGEPWIGTRADGMGKRAMSLIGGIAGLMIGLGMVMIVAPPFVGPPTGPTDRVAAADQAEEISDMQRLAATIPVRREQAVQRQETFETFEREESLSQPEESESEIIVEREVVTEAQVQLPTQPEESPQLFSATPVPTQPVPATPVPTQPVPVSAVPQNRTQPVPADLVAGETPLASVHPSTAAVSPQVDSNLQSAAPSAQLEPEPQISVAQQPLPPQSPSVVVIPVTTTSDLDRPETPTPSQHVQALPQEPVASQNDTQPLPPTRPGAKTLAAIFANMPQPKTDLAELPSDDSGVTRATEATDAIADNIIDLVSQPDAEPSPPETPVRRQESQTIQLDGNLMKSAIPLQRRSPARPVDLAKANEGISEQSIDNVFSQLKPPRQLPRESTDTDYEN